MELHLFNIAAVAIGAIAFTALVSAVVMTVRFLRHAPARPAGPLVLGEAPALHPPAAPAAPAPPPPRPPRLEAYLLSPGAPPHLRLPVRPVLGRILELNLPLRLDWNGDYPLEAVEVRVVLPNQLTYGPSLEGMIAEALASLPGASARYASGQTHTLAFFSVPRLEPHTQAQAAVPISVIPGCGGVYSIEISLNCPALGEKAHAYRLEIIEIADESQAAEISLSVPGAWTLLPDEEQRTQETGQPMDRIRSTRFTIIEPPSSPN